jgi:Fe-Mn family superoxide dismutase
MAFNLPDLPYERDALAPHISEETLDYHYGKHHKTYVDTLNKLTEGGEWEGKPLEDLVKGTSGKLFNQAAQHWNHDFYWKCMSPNGGGKPSGDLAQAIDQAFGDFDEFAERFKQASIATFGSGWGWLVKKTDGALDIVSTQNAGNPMTDDHTPLLPCDVWEHAYYIDYRNARPKYVDAFFELINWDFVAGAYRG